MRLGFAPLIRSSWPLHSAPDTYYGYLARLALRLFPIASTLTLVPTIDQYFIYTPFYTKVQINCLSDADFVRPRSQGKSGRRKCRRRPEVRGFANARNARGEKSFCYRPLPVSVQSPPFALVERTRNRGSNRRHSGGRGGERFPAPLPPHPHCACFARRFLRRALAVAGYHTRHLLAFAHFIVETVDSLSSWQHHCYSSPHQGAAESDEEKPEPVITDVSDPHSLLNVDLEKYEWAATYIVARRIEEGRLERRGWAGEVWRGGGGEVGWGLGLWWQRVRDWGEWVHGSVSLRPCFSVWEPGTEEPPGPDTPAEGVLINLAIPSSLAYVLTQLDSALHLISLTSVSPL